MKNEKHDSMKFNNTWLLETGIYQHYWAVYV